ncbi:MAG: tetratricopeptide repeat protein [Janthinobacterium lividum]
MLRAQLLGLVGVAALAWPVLARSGLDKMLACANGQDAVVALPICLAVAHDQSRSAADRAAAYANAGLLRYSAHDPDAAMESFRDALALDANSDAAYAGRADVEFATGHYDEAVADAGRAVALKPNDHPDAYLLLGTLADRNGDHQAKIDYISKAIALAPGYAQAFAIRSSGYEAQGNYDLALADLDKAIALDPSLAAAVQPKYEIIYVGRGDVEMKVGTPQAAIGDYSAALRLNPANAGWLNRRGDAYNVTGQFSNAIADLSRAIQADPSYSVAYGNRGVSYMQTGRDDLALADFDKTVSLGNAAALIYVLRGKIHQRQSDPGSARADFHKALDLLPPGDPARADIQAAINEVGNR